MLSEISLNCSSQPSCSSLIAAIWKATLKGVLPSFSESQNRCLPISSSGTESSASLSKVFVFLPGMTGSRKTRIRLAVFFSLFPVWQRSAHRLFQADARFHGADSGDGQYQRFTLGA